MLVFPIFSREISSENCCGSHSTKAQALMRFDDGKALVDTAPLTMLSFPRSLRQSEVSRTSPYGGDMNK